MRIQIDRQKRIILLKWLKNGVINTRDLEELNSQEDNLFLELIKSLPDNEDTEPETGKNGKQPHVRTQIGVSFKAISLSFLKNKAK